MKKLLQINRFMVMLIAMLTLSVTQVWGAKASVELCTSWNTSIGYTDEKTHDYTIDDLNDGTTKMTLGVQGVYRQSNSNTYFQMNKKSGYFKNTTKLPGKITKIETTWDNAKGATKCYFALNAQATTTDSLVTATAGASITFTPKAGANYFYFNIDQGSGSGSAQMTSCVVYYETATGGTDPELSFDGTLDPFTYIEGNGPSEEQTIVVKGSNLTENVEVTAPEGYECRLEDETEYSSTLSLNAEDVMEEEGVTIYVHLTEGLMAGTFNGKLTASSEGAEDAQIALAGTVTEPEVGVGFEQEWSAYTDWTFNNFASKQTGAITAHKGTYYGTTDGKSSGYMTTKNKVNPDSIKFYVTRQTTNTTSSNWLIQVSSDKSNWTTVQTQSATSMGKGTWVEVKEDLSKYTNVYVSIKYDGGTAVRNIDDVILTTREQAKSVVYNDDFENGKVTASVGDVEIMWGDTKVEEGKTVTLTNDPEDGYVLDAYDVYKYGDPDTKVTVTDGKFTMPAYDVTVSATFKVGVPAPELDLASGTYDGEQTIYVSNFDSEYHYFYTTDGTDPEADGSLDPMGTSQKYSNNDGIKISSSCTVKVIAYDAENNPSAIATYTYTINPIYTSLADFITDAPTTDRKLMLDEDDDVVIIGATSKNLYVQDAAGTTMVMYNNAAPAWTVGKRIEGTLVGKYSTYNGLNQMTLSSWDDASADNDGTMPEPKVLTELSAETFAANKGKLIKMEELYFQSTSISSNQVIAKDANNNSFVIYNTFGTMTSKTLPAIEDAADVTGVYIAYVDKSSNYTYELAVQTIAAGEAKISVAPEGGASSEEALPMALNAEVTVTPVADFTTTLNGDPLTAATTVTINEDKSITVAASRDFYTDKSVTYYYKIDMSAKAVNITQPTVGGTISADPVSASQGATITLDYEAAAHYTFGSFTVMAGETPVIVNENEGIYTFTMPNSDVAVTGIFNIMGQDTAFFVGGEGATGTSDTIARYKDELTFQLPANQFSKTGFKFAGWSDGVNVYQAGADYTLNGNKTFTATWNELSKWATTYTSNVTGIGTSNKVKIAGTDYNANKQNKGATTSVTVPAGSTELHFHALAWKDEAQTITVAGSLPFAIVADEGVSGSGSTYTLTVDPSQVAYFSIPLTNITKDSVITFQAANNKRFVLFGVNAVQPAAMDIDPTEWDFGNVKENASANKVFTITPNAFVEGDLSASFEGADAAKFSAAVSGNNVTVTFTPAAQGAMEATLKVSATNAFVTASLAGTGIAATVPEIVIPAEPVDFGKVKQDSTVADKQITVTLNYLEAATASISGSVFSIDKTTLVGGENTITISANTSVMGEVADTITITGAGAETKKIAVKMDVLSKWADIYTSNVGDDVLTDVVVIGGENYDAIKKGTGTASQSAVISVPKGTQTLHFHAAAWNNESTVLVVKQGDTQLGSFSLYKDAGVKSSSPFTLQGNNYSTEQYFHVSVAAYTATDAADITFTTTASPYRFVLYGVNQEGGIVPVLDRIEIGGTVTKTEYEVGDTFDPAGLTVSAIYTLAEVEQEPVDVTDDVEWSFEPATLTAGEYNVTATATFETKQASKDVAVSVVAPTPTITVDPVAVAFGTVAKGSEIEAKTVAVTLKAIEGNATVTLAGEGASAFSIDLTELAKDTFITITPNTADAGEFAATITIAANGADSKDVALSMTVAEMQAYTLVTDAATLHAGDVIVLGATKDDKSFVNGAMGTEKYFSSVDATIAQGVLYAIGAMEITLGAADGGMWTLTTSEGTIGTKKVKELIKDGTAAQNMWSISIADDGTALIKDNIDEANNPMRYNSSSPRFTTYATGQTAIKIYRKAVKVTETRLAADFAGGKYSTICLSGDVAKADIAGCKVYELAGKDKASDPTQIAFYEVEEKMEAGKPYLIELTGEVATLKYVPTTTPAATVDGFVGTYVAIAAAVDNVLVDKYILYNNQIALCGANCSLGAKKAYIIMDDVPVEGAQPAPGRRRVVLGANTPTSLVTISAPAGEVRKVIVEGQFYIIRDGKAYNAAGQLVK